MLISLDYFTFSRSIFDFESFRKLLSSPKSLFWVEMTRHPFGRFTLEWNWEVGFQVLTIMETMKSGRLWFFFFWAFSLQPRKPSVLKEPCFPFLSFCALRKQATLIEAFYLQITSNNLIKGWLNRTGKSGEGRGVSRRGDWACSLRARLPRWCLGGFDSGSYGGWW
ncbi:hypothetical protein ACFX15_004033 [Malus domestica]